MVQEVTTSSWFSRIGNAFVGILVGIALIIGSFMLVFWNEGNGLHKAQSLKQTEKMLVTTPISPIDKKNELKVVYFSGLATTDESLKDSLLEIDTKAIKLDRNVEMFQWEQEQESKTEKNMGGSETETKTYTYKTAWSDKIIDSSNFKELNGHKNPTSMAFPSRHEQASKVTVGDFILPTDLISKISVTTPVDLTEKDISVIQNKTKLKVSHNGIDLYLGEDSQTPRVGDVRIHVTEILPQIVSVIAQQTGNTVQAYMAPAGHPIALLVSGQQSYPQMIHDAEVENRMLTWLFRGVSLLLMIIGFTLILKPIAVLADIIPFFGNIVGYGTGLIAFVAGLLLWTCATALAWFVVRPLLAVGLVVIACLISYGLIQRKKNSLEKTS